MITFYTLYVIAFVFVQIVSSQGIPEECKAPPPYVEKPLECCNIPEFFNENDLKDCGFQKSQGPPPPGHPPGVPPCDKQACLLKKYDMMKDDSTLDKDKVMVVLNEYASKNQQFAPAIEDAKEDCLSKDLSRFGPPQICEPIKLMMCISSAIFANCPAWTDSEQCGALKSHIDKCRPHMLN